MIIIALCLLPTTKGRLVPLEGENNLLEFLLYHQSVGRCFFLAFILLSLALSIPQSITMFFEGSSMDSLNSNQSLDAVSIILDKSDIKPIWHTNWI